MNDKNGALLRLLTLDDVPSAFALSAEAGWNQTEDDWRMLINLSPQGCLGIEVDGQLAASATLVCYQRSLAWVGMVLTKRKYSGRGFATRLLAEALRLADDWGIETLKLDATDQGQPIYEKLGFRPEQVTERWELAGESSQNFANIRGNRGEPAALEIDRAAFGVDRSALLRELSVRGSRHSTSDGFLLTRPGRIHRYLGPCVATSPKTAAELIRSGMQSFAGSGWYWDLLAENKSATTLAAKLGFVPKRRLLRMIRGRGLRGKEQNVYSLAGFELG